MKLFLIALIIGMGGVIGYEAYDQHQQREAAKANLKIQVRPRLSTSNAMKQWKEFRACVNDGDTVENCMYLTEE